MWRHLLAIVVILHTAHVPVPVPDLDGEWQGVAIGGLADPSAWGVVMLGVLPADDIDRGPIRHDVPGDTTVPVRPPLGDATIAETVKAWHVVSAIRHVCGVCVPAMVAAWSMQPACSGSACAKERDHSGAAFISPIAVRATLCVWHV